jgi:hypothetical protein
MRKINAMILALVIGFTAIFVSGPAVNAAPSAEPAAQVVPKTKHYSKKAYRGGRRVTVVTYRHGKRITKKVWRTGNRWGHKAGRKTKHFFMGPSKKRP